MREKAEDPYVSLGICSRCHKGILGTQYKMCAECREKKAKVEAKRLARETPEQAEAGSFYRSSGCRQVQF